MNTTPWFDGTTKPIRFGVYETRDSGSFPTLRDYRYWRNGWHVAGLTIDAAAENCELPSAITPDQWRGVTSDNP